MSSDVDKLTQSQGIVKLEFQNEPSDTEFNQKLNLLKQNPEIKNIGLFFDRGGNAVSIGTSNVFYVKLKNASDFDILQKLNRIEVSYPNPTSDIINVNYKINKGESAYLKIVKIYPATIVASDNAFKNHILNVNNNTTILNLSNLSDGLYKIILVVDGQISDTKTLIKQ